MNRTHTLQTLLAVVAAWLPLMSAGAAAGGPAGRTCPVVQIEVERLPSLNTPRNLHHTLCVNGEPVVLGGHADGFIPVKTAEYLKDGEWHEVPMVYTHDDGMALQLASGRVLLAGGYEKDFGIGQVFSAEVYDPSAHAFESVSILDMKRAKSGAAELDSGRVVVSGNWYHSDAFGLFDGHLMFDSVWPVSQERTYPWVLRTGPSDAIAIGACDPHGERFDTIVVDRLHGEPFRPELFRLWRPLPMHRPFQSNSGFIGDEEAGRYDYLLPVVDRQGQVAICLMSDGQFSLLPTDRPVPMRDAYWKSRVDASVRGDWTGDIVWFSPVIADRQARRAYLVGFDKSTAQSFLLYYVLQIDYDRQPARLTLLYAGNQPDVGYSTPTLTADGNLLMAGGATTTNFRNFNAVVVFRVADETAAAGAFPAWWTWLLAALVVLSLLAVAYVMYRRSRQSAAAPAVVCQPADEPSAAAAAESGAADGYDELMNRIEHLMEREKMYLDSSLKVSDVAGRLGVRGRVVSDCIKAKRGCLFAQFVNIYRVEYAKTLLRTYPDIKMAAVWTGSGFANETTFFRTFKTLTGMPPKEWMATND